jgi:hypothetical protein
VALLNYTTKIPAKESAGQVLGMLATAGADRITLINDRASREPTGVEFEIETVVGWQAFRLPVNARAIQVLLDATRKERRAGPTTDEQARAVGWRIVKDWTEAQLALIQTGMVKLEEVFLPYMIHGPTGMTMFEAFEHRQLALKAGEATRG